MSDAPERIWLGVAACKWRRHVRMAEMRKLTEAQE